MKKKVLSSSNMSGRVRTGYVPERERINSPTVSQNSLGILFITFKIPNSRLKKSLAGQVAYVKRAVLHVWSGALSQENISKLTV